MLKIIILFSFLFFSGCAYKSTKITQNLSVKIENANLKNTVYSFWNYRLNNDFENMYKLEIPYFRYLYDFELYKSYYKNHLFEPTDKVIIKSLVNSKDNSNIIMSFIEVVDKNNNVKLKWNDSWADVDGSFYHITKDFLIFKEM